MSKTRSIPYWIASVFSSLWLAWVWFTSHSRLVYERWMPNDNSLTTELSNDWRRMKNEESTESESESESESYVMTNGQSASLSWNKAPIWGLR
jgi:hypothetical protein